MNTRIRTIAITAVIANACSNHSAARCQNGAFASMRRGGRVVGGTLMREFDRRLCRSAVLVTCVSPARRTSFGVSSFGALLTRTRSLSRPGSRLQESSRVHENTRR